MDDSIKSVWYWIVALSVLGAPSAATFFETAPSR
jgi:hypothetical protein